MKDEGLGGGKIGYHKYTLLYIINKKWTTDI
jgi:hypothetical protein